MDKAANYRIKVKGELHQSFSDRLQGMSITVDRSAARKPVTTLEGFLRDQAALSGVLNMLYEMHFSVLSVECLEESENRLDLGLKKKKAPGNF
jgi:hypothetical protein